MEHNSTLLHELENVITLIHSQARQAHADATLALVYLTNSISLEDWLTVRNEHQFSRWTAIPLDVKQSEVLATLLSAQETLIKQRDEDALTRLFNRGYFDAALQREFERAARTHAELSLVMFDLDDFKKVNDTYGHAYGDTVLKRCAELLKRTCRTYDVAARFGGEEFALILPATSAWTAQFIANRFRRLWQKETFTYLDTTFSLTISGGVASIALMNSKDKSSDLLVQLADQALYSAKKAGKNAVHVASSEKLTKDLRTLVQNDEKQFLFSGDPME